jgi:hypothetical protein
MHPQSSATAIGPTALIPIACPLIDTLLAPDTVIDPSRTTLPGRILAGRTLREK